MPDTSQNPNVVSCVSDPTNYSFGITYDQSSFATPAGLKIDIFSTATVQPTAAPGTVTAVSVTGRINNATQILVRNGAVVSATGTALLATTTGTGAASIDNHSAITGGTGGLLAVADTSGGSGLGSVINQSDGSVTLVLPATPGTTYGLLAQGGSASVLNNSTVSATNATGDGGPVSGLAAGSYAAGGTQTITNAATVTLTGTSASYIGMNSIASSGAVSLTNTGTVTVASTLNSATGMRVGQSGTGGAVTLSNTGALAVTSGGAGAAQAAVGMDVQLGTSVNLANTQVAGGTTTFAVTGGNAIGQRVANATGAVSVTNTGIAFAITGGSATTATATGVTVSGGTSQTVHFNDTKIGSTVYADDLVVQAGGAAKGVVLAGGSGALDVTLSGAALGVTSTSAGATGISTSGGSTVQINMVPDAANARAAGFVVTGGGNASTSTGIALSGNSGAASITMGDSFTVANTANGGGRAVGATLDGGTDATITLTKGLTVTGLGAQGIIAGLATAQTGADSLTSSAAITVDGKAGSADGIVLRGNAASANLTSLTVTGATGATGASLAGGSGAVSLTTSDVFNVTSSGGSAFGVNVTSGAAETVTLAKGVTVSGANAVYAVQMRGTGDVAMTTPAAIAVTSTAGTAFAAQQLSGANETFTLQSSVTVNGSTFAGGFLQSGATGAETMTFNGAVSVTSTTGPGVGLAQSGGTSQTLTAQGPVTVVSGVGGTYGIQQTNSTGAASITAQGPISVTNTGGLVLGVSQRQATSRTATLNGDLTVSGAGDGTVGIGQVGGTGASQITTAGNLVVSTSAGGASAVLVNGGGAATVTLGKGLTVTGSGGRTAGVKVIGGAGATIAVNGALNSTANTGGDAYGIDLSGATGLSAIHVPAGVLIRATAANGNAWGISATDGVGLTIDPPDITVSATGNAFGVASSGQVGAQNVTLGTISVTSTGAQATGVSLAGDGAITVADAASITANAATAGGYGVRLQQTGTSGSIAGTLASVVTTGPGTVGVGVVGSQSGASSVTLGTLAGSTHGGGVSTSGAASHGVVMTVAGGSGTLTNNGTIAVSGAGAEGIIAAATGTGALTISNWTVTTSSGTGIDVAGAGGAVAITSNAVTAGGSGVTGILATNTTGALSINSQSVTVGNAAGGNAISATTGSGALAVTALNSSAAGADAIKVQSTTGNATVNLADGGTTTSGKGAGLLVNTGGTATINLGSSATTAVLSGTTAGINSTATGGQTVTLSGTVGAGNNAAVILAGGAATLVNKGTINGTLTLSSAGNTVTNSGIWNAFGGDSTFGGVSTLANSGTINLYPAATVATTLRLVSLTSLANSGTVSLVNGHTGDILDLGAAAYSGSGAAKLVVDANLGTAAVGASAPQTADLLRTTGATSGTTVLVINDIAATQGGQFNFSGVRVVSSAAGSTGTFTLQGGAFYKGFVQYLLVQDAASNWNLVGVPSAGAFETVRTAAEAQKYWRRSGDAWVEQMHSTPLVRGSSLWMQVIGGGQTDKSTPSYSATLLGRATSFTPNLDLHHTWGGVQTGYQFGRDGWGVGLTGGYAQQTGRFNATGDQIKLSGGNFGGYLRLQSQGGVYLNVLGKVDRYSVTYTISAPASAPSFHGTTYGAAIELGARLHSGAMFFEPAASLQVTHTDLDGFQGGSGGFAVQFSNSGSTFGRVGLRAGLDKDAGGWKLQPYLGAAWEGELHDTGHALLTSNGTGLDYADKAEGGHARLEAGLQGTNGTGLAAFAKFEVIAGSQAHGASGRIGLAYHW